MVIKELDTNWENAIKVFTEISALGDGNFGRRTKPPLSYQLSATYN